MSIGNSTAEHDLNALRAGIAGQVSVPGQTGYDQARQAWNLAVDQRPDVVVVAESASDVVTAIRYARAHGMRIAPQGTGHGAAPLDALDGAMLLRTTPMRKVDIDPASRIARAEAGALWQDVMVPAAEHGLAGLAGFSPDLGVAGHILGGGLSWLGRCYGLAANNVEAFELVTADGELVRADAVSEPDLFWALRGGGGSFGIVTGIEFALFPHADMYAGVLWYPIERGHEVLHAWRELTQDNPPDELTTVGRFVNFPPIPDIPEQIRGKSFVLVEVFHLGKPVQADKWLAGLRALGPVNDTVATVPIPAVSHIHMDPEQPVPYAGDSLLLDDLPSAAVNAFIEVSGANAAYPLLSAEIRHLGGELPGRVQETGRLRASTRSTSCTWSAWHRSRRSRRRLPTRSPRSSGRWRPGHPRGCTSTSPKRSARSSCSGPRRPTGACAISRRKSIPAT